MRHVGLEPTTFAWLCTKCDGKVTQYTGRYKYNALTN